MKVRQLVCVAGELGKKQFEGMVGDVAMQGAQRKVLG